MLACGARVRAVTPPHRSEVAVSATPPPPYGPPPGHCTAPRLVGDGAAGGGGVGLACVLGEGGMVRKVRAPYDQSLKKWGHPVPPPL